MAIKKGDKQRTPLIEPIPRSNGRVVKYTAEQRANATAMMIAGHSYTEITKATGVARQSLTRWFSELGPEVFARAAEGRKSLEEMIEDLARENITTLIEHSRQMRNPEWILKQNAHDLGMLDAVLTDKTVRIVMVWQAAQMRRAALALPGG